MRRIFPRRLLSLGCCDRRLNGDSLLDGIFSELSACDITRKENQPNTQSAVITKRESSDGSVNSALKESVAFADEAEIRAELSKHDQLQLMVREVLEKAAMHKTDEIKANDVRRHARYVASPPAELHLSSAELVHEKSPQHFTPSKESSTKLSALPHADSPGTVAVVTLVGKVLSVATVHGEGSGTGEVDDVSVGESGPHARFLVQYKVPFIPSSKPVTVQVRCYGATLTSFAKHYIHIGDLVHVLGHVLPLDTTSVGDPAFCVCALPVGGNISVVLSAEQAAEI